jgi:hypothetical protein
MMKRLEPRALSLPAIRERLRDLSFELLEVIENHDHLLTVANPADPRAVAALEASAGRMERLETSLSFVRRLWSERQ